MQSIIAKVFLCSLSYIIIIIIILHSILHVLHEQMLGKF